jgi:predicted RNase H-like nuclease (RuvC/YqgF family)
MVNRQQENIGKLQGEVNRRNSENADLKIEIEVFKEKVDEKEEETKEIKENKECIEKRNSELENELQSQKVQVDSLTTHLSNFFTNNSPSTILPRGQIFFKRLLSRSSKERFFSFSASSCLQTL